MSYDVVIKFKIKFFVHYINVIKSTHNLFCSYLAFLIWFLSESVIQSLFSLYHRANTNELRMYLLLDDSMRKKCCMAIWSL